MSVTVVFAVTLACFTVKVAVDFPARTVTVVGTDAAPVFELFRLTTKPPVGAIPLRVTVPVTAVVELPLTVVGETEIDNRAGAVIDRVACCELEPSVAVTVADVIELTAKVFTVN